MVIRDPRLKHPFHGVYNLVLGVELIKTLSHILHSWEDLLGSKTEEMGNVDFCYS